MRKSLQKDKKNRDHQGNVREVVDRTGTVLQVTDYYPYGAPFCDATSSIGASVQPYKYGGKELEAMHGLNLYDFLARWHNPADGAFTSMDPFCEKYYHISPYAYCAGNPVKYMDPDGRDVYTIKPDGSWTVDVDTSQDLIRFIDNSGGQGTCMVNGEPLPVNDIAMEYGCVHISGGTAKDKDGNEVPYSVFTINNDTNGTNVFESLAAAGSVEFSLITTGGENGTNYITTSHHRNQDAGLGTFESNLEGVEIRSISHNHPGGSQTPSGRTERNGMAPGTWGDEGFANRIKRSRPNVLFNIAVVRNDVQNIKFKYIEFSGNPR